MTTEQCAVEVLKEAGWTWWEDMEDESPCGRWIDRYTAEREVTGTVWRRGDEVGWTVKVNGEERKSEVYDTLYTDPDAIWTVEEQASEMARDIELCEWNRWRN